MTMGTISRRGVLAGALGVTGASAIRLSFARAATHRRLIVIILRGGLDGLAAVPAIGDPAYGAARRGLALAETALDLGDGFALHPALPTCHQLYRAGDLAVIHAVATPYRGRSHFDAQDMLETGGDGRHQPADGWLNRSLGLLGDPPATGVAVGPAVPLILRGPAAAGSWMAAGSDGVDADFADRAAALYAGDPLLAPALAMARTTAAMAANTESGRGRGRPVAGMVEGLATVMGAGGARIAVLDFGGWDTHANQGDVSGRLANQLARLDQGLAAARTAFAQAWRETVILVVTEFGRTVAMNGTGGTDHGTAGVAFLAGGAVAGGRVIADWPGLAGASLYQGRDLRPTLDLRAVFKGVLRDHLAITPDALDRVVFPGQPVAPLDHLIRA